eukprot:CAMPEP_0177677678 /NCGR_PEP_ID=MMETSP0447-20121125/28552_1 /TAXON_ID=0 /ORGANISM="Stygamoeba regulata, Strain BSH-02190019" /LENGTH=55 /DNA_ID=CAMNT_0019186527 /DNA_START=85 /DNA_END=249 /DNA_ORIENTATION=+
MAMVCAAANVSALMYTGWLLLFEALFVFIAGDPRAPAEEPPLAPPTATLRPASEP